MVLPTPPSYLTPPVPVSHAEVRAVVDENYGPVAEWTVLGGESDLNVRVTLPVGPALLKVSRADDAAFADFQTALLAHLMRCDPPLPVPALVPTLAGANAVHTDRGFTQPVHMRVTSFLRGMPR